MKCARCGNDLAKGHKCPPWPAMHSPKAIRAGWTEADIRALIRDEMKKESLWNKVKSWLRR